VSYRQIRPKDAAEKIKTNRARLIDVREPHEFEIARVAGAELLPMSRLPAWIDTLNPQDELIVMCHHGIRSAHVCQFLISRGFANVSNLTGGIDLWSDEVDESVPHY
jgi:rhodanese-related sulfurtransferase